MRWSLAAASLVVLVAGCAHTVVGAPGPATEALKVLPTEETITAAVGNALSTFGFKPFVGGAEILPDGYRTDAEAAPISCVGVTDTAPRIVYERLAVVEAARQSYFNWDQGVGISGADAAVVRLGTADAAHDAFETLAGQWQRCSDTTVVKHVGGTVIDAEITDVNVQGSVVSATIVTHQRPNSAVSRYERALGVRDGTLVEVSLAITPAIAREPDPRTRAVGLAQVMLEKSR